MSGFIHFVIGGSRSGKSGRAESLAIASGQAVAYIATYAADPLDEEMRIRVERHQRQRPGLWRTIETVLTSRISSERAKTFCCSLIAFLMALLPPDGRALFGSDFIGVGTDASVGARVRAVFDYCEQRSRGESGAIDSEGRSFRDLCGLANQLVAHARDDR